MSFIRMFQRWIWLTMVPAMALINPVEKGATPGMMQLENFISNSPQSLCMYVKCQEPFDVTNCEKNSVYVAGTGQFGCCGACVVFKKQDDTNCTGSIDPEYGGGYSALNNALTLEMLQDFDASTGSNNHVFSSWCDYGLKCNEKQVCVTGGESVGGCLYIRQKYYEALDSSNYNHYRDDYRWPPECTQEGEFFAVQRKGPLGEEMYVCVDRAGNTIYGRIFSWQEDLLANMNCKCSRKVWERQQAGDLSITLHCMENGNYEPLQCEDGWCYCVNSDSGEAYGTLIPEDTMQLLPCYNATLVGAQYFRRCESQSVAHTQLMEYMLAKGVYGPAGLYRCDPDGSYSGEQCIHGQCRCYDKYMFSILKLSSGGGCNCARDQWFYDSQGNFYATLNCASSSSGEDAGLYYTYQYYGDTGVYCVDQDGVRSSPMIYTKYFPSLNCTAASLCQNGLNDVCENACKYCKNSAYVKYPDDK